MRRRVVKRRRNTVHPWMLRCAAPARSNAEPRGADGPHLVPSAATATVRSSQARPQNGQGRRVADGEALIGRDAGSGPRGTRRCDRCGEPSKCTGDSTSFARGVAGVQKTRCAIRFAIVQMDRIPSGPPVWGTSALGADCSRRGTLCSAPVALRSMGAPIHPNSKANLSGKRLLPRIASCGRARHEPAAASRSASGGRHRRGTGTAPLGLRRLDGGLGRRFGSLGLTLDGIGTAPAPPGGRDEADGPRMRRVLRSLDCCARRPGCARHRWWWTGFPTMPDSAPARSWHSPWARRCAAVRTRSHAPRDRRNSRSRRALGHRHRRLRAGRLPARWRPRRKRRAAADHQPSRVPGHWRVVLIFDPAARGLHGASEDAAFRALPPFPEAGGASCRLVLMNLLPALAEADLSIRARGRRAAARHRRPFRTRSGRALHERAGGRGAGPARGGGRDCIGQSSWGPTGFGVVEAEARRQIGRTANSSSRARGSLSSSAAAQSRRRHPLQPARPRA